MPCSSQGSPGDRQRKTSSYTPSLAPIPPPRVLEEILWRRRSGISLGFVGRRSQAISSTFHSACHASNHKQTASLAFVLDFHHGGNLGRVEQAENDLENAGRPLAGVRNPFVHAVF